MADNPNTPQDTDDLTLYYESVLTSLKLMCSRIEDPKIAEICLTNGSSALSNIYVMALAGNELCRVALRHLSGMAVERVLAAGLLAPGPAPKPRVQ